MAKKYYAIIKGKKTGIFETWNETKEYISGYKGAIYKSFLSLDEAQEYYEKLKNSKNEISINSDVENDVFKNYELGIYSFFVDGSFNKRKNKIGYGVVCVFNDIIHMHHGSLSKNETLEFSKSLNIAGEIFGSLYAIKYAVHNNLSKIKIYYDYEGIEKWVSGAWSTNTPISKFYKSEFNNIINSKSINILFQKVRAHNKIKFNDLADELAKKGSN